MLINILVSFGIIALLSTVSIPYLKKYQANLKLSSSARNLTADLRYAQQQTISEQITHKVFLDFANDNYQILRIDTSTSTIKNVFFENEVSYQAISGFSGNYVVFNAYGAVSEAGQIVLTNNSNITATINIKPSGYVELSM